MADAEKVLPPETVEVPTQDVAPEVKEVPQNEVEAEAAPKKVETPQQVNFRNLRQQKEQAEKERDEALRALQSKSATPTLEENFNLASDDLVEGKHLQAQQRRLQELEGQVMEAKLKAQYKDFDAVVSKENVDNLKSQYPELAQTIGQSGDLYGKAVSAYTMIKKLGIHVEDTHKEDRERAQANSAKPRPLASVSPQQGDSPLSHANAFANGLTPELQSQLRKEMAEARKKM
jgi:outer membrane biosynthesis protein TonB